MKKSRTHIFVIVGIIVGVLMLVLFCLFYYIIPLYKGEKIKKIPFVDNEKINKKRLIKKFEENGFYCTEMDCYKEETGGNGVSYQYEINFEEKNIYEYFDLYMDDGKVAHVGAKYFYEQNATYSTMIVTGSNNEPLDMFEYNAHWDTDYRYCNKEMNLCSFNYSISSDLMNYYNSMIE